MRRRLRRHARLLCGALAILVIAGLAYGLRSAGPVHAQPARATSAPGPKAQSPSKAVAAVASPQALTVRLARPASAAHRPVAAPARRNARRAGPPSGAPSQRALAQALRQSTGLSPSEVTSRPVCGRPTPGHASCAARTLVHRSGGARVRPRVTPQRSLGQVRPARAPGARPGSVPWTRAPQPATPAYLQQAYDLSYLSQSGGGGDTVAVVDAYDDPSAEADLNVYRTTFGLPACTTANGCFKEVNQSGGPAPLPPAQPDWQQEISLDLDAVSAICPRCHILLVEASSSSFSDLQAAMNTAHLLGANQISASWSGTQDTVPTVFHTFSGVATVAATGDYGYAGDGEDNYPAALPSVTAAGGTSLAPAAGSGARGFSEGAWSLDGSGGGGSGCDLHYSRPSYQPAKGCTGRAYADLSADADPSTGLAVYDHGSWSLIGGTSLSAPLIAGYYAITGASAGTPRWAYTNSGLLNDVVSGSTGACAARISYICQAGPGFDGPTGVGSMSGAVITGAPGIGGPSVSSGSSAGNTYAQSVRSRAATIAAGVYRNGLDTNWWVEYGTTTAYGLQTPPSDIGAGSAPAAVTGYPSGLLPGSVYHYRIVARNGLGTTYGYDYTFTTPTDPSPAPTAAFAVSSGATAPGAAVTFDASSSAPGGSISDYSWNFGDGTTADSGTAAIAAHPYAARGTYAVTLTVTSGGQTDTSTQTVTVDDPPTAAFTLSETAVAPGTPVALNAATSAAGAGGSLTDYSWSFGDGTFADAGASAGATHTFNAPGTYTVTLTTTDDLDVTATVSQQITVATFTVSPQLPSPGAPVTFTALPPGPAGGTATDYIWDFGDGSTADTGSTPSAIHTYAASGRYPVTLTTKTSTDGSATSNASSTSDASVAVDDPPTAAFSPSAPAVAPGTPISFDGSASRPADGRSIADYSWDFGDGSHPKDKGTSTGATHTYTSPGLYAVTLTITDDLGGTATTSHQVMVDQPTASFATSPTTLTANTPATFDASGSSTFASAIVDYTWDFGEGAVDARASSTATHTFASAGTHPVKLTVTDQLGFADSTTQYVVVSPAVAQAAGTPPSPAPVISPSPVPPGSPPAAPAGLAASVTGSGRQRVAHALAHGLALGLTINQSARVSFQITVPLAQTKLGRRVSQHSPFAKRRRKAPFVLLRRAQTLAAGGYAITFKLSRAVIGQLVPTRPLVMTIRVTVDGAGGQKLTRIATYTLTR
jgi:PKD repeat protein